MQRMFLNRPVPKQSREKGHMTWQVATVSRGSSQRKEDSKRRCKSPASANRNFPSVSSFSFIFLTFLGGSVTPADLVYLFLFPFTVRDRIRSTNTDNFYW